MSLPRIVHSRDLRLLDQAIGLKAKRFSYRNSQFYFDCRFCDEHIQDGSFAFGIAREIYIRDCYFKFHPSTVYESARTVIDLGANRGGFSALMAPRADFVLSVEAKAEFIPVIHHNMALNGFANYVIECGFVGSGGSLNETGFPKLKIDELLNRHHLTSVDLIKLDIEGSEFDIFSSPSWLRHVNAISMEIHPDHGDPNLVLDALRHHGFKYVTSDENLKRITDVTNASFVYAWKRA